MFRSIILYILKKIHILPGITNIAYSSKWVSSYEKVDNDYFLPSKFTAGMKGDMIRSMARKNYCSGWFVVKNYIYECTFTFETFDINYDTFVVLLFKMYITLYKG